MPQKARLEARPPRLLGWRAGLSLRWRAGPCVLHHIIIRGIERRKILKDDQDLKNYFSRLFITNTDQVVETY
jgi:hypothetical protein